MTFSSLTIAVLLASAPTTASLVVPGRSLGGVVLGADASTLATLGKAGYGDGAMQKAWATWFGARPAGGGPAAQLDIYTALTNNDVDHHTVQVVRATSSWFHLANGLRAGSRLSAIRAAYGALPLAATYQLAGAPHYLYDDVRRGIAFETDGKGSASRCQALIIHLPGRAVMATYLSMPEYLKQVPRH